MGEQRLKYHVEVEITSSKVTCLTSEAAHVGPQRRVQVTRQQSEHAHTHTRASARHDG
jgi:hypothetical protein